jgi:hypothetical protein
MPVHTYTTLNDSSSGTIATDARGINGSAAAITAGIAAYVAFRGG